MLELIETKTLKHYKNPRAAFQGYLFVFQKKCKEYCRWKCTRIVSYRCPCVLKTSLDIHDMHIVGIDHEHNHPDDMKAINDLKLRLVLSEKPGNHKTWFKTTYPTTERNNFKRFIPEDVKNYKIPKQFIITKEDFHVTQSPNQNEIEKLNYHQNAINNNVNEMTLTDICTTFPHSFISNQTYSSILRQILSSSKSNCDRIPKCMLTNEESNYAEISNKILQKRKISHLKKKKKNILSNEQEKMNILFWETDNRKNTTIEHNRFDINYISKNFKRMYVEDTDYSIKRNKKICVDKIQCINFEVDDIDISICDGKKMYGSVVEDNNIDENDDAFSTLINDFNSKNFDNLLKKLNNPKIGKEVFNRLVQMQFISYFLHSSDINLNHQLNGFKIRELHWKNKFKNVFLDMKKIRKSYLKILNKDKYLPNHPNYEKFNIKSIGIQVDIKKEMEVQFSKKNSTKIYNSKLLSDIIQIDTTDSEDESLNNQKSNITISKKSDISNSEIICLDTSSRQVFTDVTEKIESNRLNSICTPKFVTLKNIKSIIRNQNVLDYNSIYSKKIPIIRAKYIPKTSVLRMNPKKEFIKISLTNKSSYLDTQHLHNTITLNNELFYAKLMKPINSKFIEKKKLKNFSNKIVILDKISLPDLLQNTQVFQKNLYSQDFNFRKLCSSLPIKSTHFTLLYSEILRYNTIKIHGPFLENLNDTEKYIHPPPVVTTVFLSYTTIPPKAVLKWDFESNTYSIQTIKNIIDYEVAIIAIRNNKIVDNGWNQIGNIKALKLPMTCTVQLVEANKTTYYFAIRARDIEKRYGPFCISSPLTF